MNVLDLVWRFLNVLVLWMLGTASASPALEETQTGSGPQSIREKRHWQHGGMINSGFLTQHPHYIHGGHIGHPNSHHHGVVSHPCRRLGKHHKKSLKKTHHKSGANTSDSDSLSDSCSSDSD